MSLDSAIILAAGEGTRMKSRRPKTLFTLGGRTFLNRVMSAAGAANPKILSVVVRYGKDQVEAEALRAFPKAVIVEQDEIPGTGRAVQCAMSRLAGDIAAIDPRGDGSVLIAAGDMPLLDASTLSSLMDAHERSGAVATVLTTVLDSPFGYGRVVRGADGSVEKIVEERDATDGQRAIREVNTSVYVFQTSVLAQAIANLDSQNDQNEFYLTDAIEFAGNYGRVGAFAAPDSLAVEGVNDRVQLSRLAKAHNRRVCERWMREGVSILDPDTTWIDDDVRLARDVELLPNTFLRGRTVVGEGTVIGPDVELVDMKIGQDARIHRALMQNSVVGPRAEVGPFSYMRPGCMLGGGAKQGTCVEMKKSTIGDGTKVPHLSYIGDTTIGDHTNIGGGTITANYDGKHKNPTTIGSDVHIGVDNMLVAPVEVADGVTTGAGAVIRHYVHRGSLAYSENTQHEVRYWTPKSQRPASSRDNNEKDNKGGAR